MDRRSGKRAAAHVADSGRNDLAFLKRWHFTLIEWQRDTPVAHDKICHQE
jgi:hypothetical protein